MAVYFTGTATKQTYQVGREYVNSRGQVVTANKDGSFGNRETGQVMRGSSYNPTVAWYADGADANMWGAYHNGAAQASFRTDSGKEVFTRPALAAPTGHGGSDVQRVAPVAAAAVAPVASVRISAPVVSMGNRGAFLRDSAWSGKDDPPQDLLIGGFHWQSNPRMTNAEMVEVRYGDNELVSTVFGVATIGADLGYNARRLAEQHGFNGGQGVVDAGKRALAPNAVGDALNSVRNGLNAWSSQHNADVARQRAAEEDFNDVLDLKMSLQKEEWDKRFTVVNPGSQDWRQDRLTPNVWGY